jgi:8-oxo-dGTP pyrophosphatase MutT (NUDIX family)
MEQVSSRVVYRNPWITVREDAIRRPDGSRALYGVVEKPDFALVLPRCSRGFWLVEQYRYPVRRRAWEFPQGSWSGDHTGQPIELAQQELAEETGLRAASMAHLGHLYAAYGLSTQGFDVYLATGLTEGVPDREVSEQDMQHRAFTDEEIEQLIASGQLVDAPSLAALTLYRLRERRAGHIR